MIKNYLSTKVIACYGVISTKEIAKGLTSKCLPNLNLMARNEGRAGQGKAAGGGYT
jgi:hypothetical protein